MNKEEISELKPCPFCGGKDLSIIFLDEEGHPQPFYNELSKYACVVCDKCDLRMSEQLPNNSDTILLFDIILLFNKWNTRVE